MNIRIRASWLAVLAVFASGTSLAQQLYVADKLVLNVYAEANQSGGRVATIETGDTVEEIERSEDFVHVRLPDGREGWVGANYLSDQPPAITRLKELQAAKPGVAPASPPKELTDEVARLRKQNASLTSEIAELKKKSSVQSPPVSPASAPPVNEPSPTTSTVEPDEPESEPVVVVQRSYWWAWTLGLIAAGGVGFFAGYQTLGRRVRERFGGVKVY
jgi:hypothetical protein